MSNSIDTAALLQTIGRLYVINDALRAENEALKVTVRRLEAQRASNESPTPSEEPAS